MLRRTLLAALLCLSVWAAHHVLATAPADNARVTGTATTLSERPSDDDGPDAAWTAPARYCISVNEASRQLHDGSVAGTSRRNGWFSIHRDEAPGDATPFRSPHLHHAPLLI